MPNTKPLVQVAAVCEKVLQEKDNVLSAIRLVDTFYLLNEPPPNLPADIKPGAQVTALVCLKSGDITGEHQIEIKMRNPSGETKAVGKWPVILNGGEHGANLTINMVISAVEYGLWWFDVIWEGEVLTSIPLKLAPQPKPEPGPDKSSPQK